MKGKILIVDDVDINVDILSDIFEDDYELVTANDGVSAIGIIEENHKNLDMVLLDINMPNMNGMEVLRIMRDKNILSELPVLMITAENSTEAENDCLKLGATDFIRKPFSASLVKTRVRNTVSLYNYKNHLEDTVKEQTDKIKHTSRSMVEILGNLVESRNLESGQHVQRVSKYTGMMAQAMMQLHPEYCLTDEKIEVIAEAAALHDVGKIAISDAILLKPGRLTDDEFTKMKEHTTLGSEYIKNVKGIWDEDYAQTCYDIARYHHERHDGRGYPEGLKGDDIPISAQLVSVADVYDALIEERCYKKAFTKEKAFEMITNGECGIFSPKLIECFVKCYPFE